MPPLVSIRKNFPERAKADSLLLLHLDPANSGTKGLDHIYPKAGAEPPLVAPWIWYRQPEEIATDAEGIITNQVIEFWIYGDPKQLYYDVDLIAADLKRIYKAGPVEFYDAGGSGWFLRYAGSSDSTQEESFGQTLKILRWELLRS